jgi:hypothetical protein
VTIRLTIRNGPRVERERFASLDEAIAALRRRAGEIRGEGSLEGVSMLRDFAPGEQVRARLELSVGGFLRSREAGVDVMGDGRVVPHAGAIRRRELDSAGHRDPFDAVREALSQGGT